MDSITPQKVIELCRFRAKLSADSKIDASLKAPTLPWFNSWWKNTYSHHSTLARWLNSRFCAEDATALFAGFTTNGFVDLEDILLFRSEKLTIICPDFTPAKQMKFEIEVLKYKSSKKSRKILSFPEIETRYDGNKFDFKMFAIWIMSNLQSIIDMSAEKLARCIMEVEDPLEPEHLSFITQLILTNTSSQAHTYLLQTDKQGVELLMEMFAVFGERMMQDNVDVLRNALCNPRLSGLELNDWIDKNLQELTTYNITLDTLVFSTVIQNIQGMPNNQVLLDKIFSVKDTIDWTQIKSWIKAASEQVESLTETIHGADIAFLDNMNTDKHMMVDTGSRHHILSKLPPKKQFAPKKVSKFISAYGGSQVKVEGVGEFKLTTGRDPIVLSNTLFIPQGQENIFSPICALNDNDRYESITLAGKAEKSFIKCKNGTIIPLTFHGTKGWYINMDN
jgi:hypothetical protein